MAIAARSNAGFPTGFTYPGQATKKQNGRIVAVAAIKTDLDISGWDSMNTAAWEALVTSEDLVKLGPVTGQFPQASENTEPGDGYLDMTTASMNQDVAFKHYGPDVNLAIYQKLMQQSKYGTWSMIFVFEDLVGYVPTLEETLELLPVSIFARPGSESEDLGSSRRIYVNARYRISGLPTVIPTLDATFWKLN